MLPVRANFVATSMRLQRCKVGATTGLAGWMGPEAGVRVARQCTFQSATVTVGLRQRTNEQPRGVWLFEERFTAMRRTEQQPGGVTDAQMLSDPRRSDRDRNWFEVDWNIGSMDVTWLLQRRDIDVQGSVHGLLASRKSLGFLGTPNRVDPGVERDLIR